MRRITSARRIIGLLALATWTAAVVAGMVGMVRYEARPAAAAADLEHRAPMRWPATVRIAREAQRPTLVMSLHPQCPCSRASVQELAMLMSRADARVAAHVLFVRPSGAPSNWLDTDLWKAASAIPRVSVSIDPDGADSAALGATTSGQVVLYGGNGSLQFAGGITDGRGHEGDNAGLDAILALLRDEKPATVTTPVFGCPLHGNSDLAACGPRRTP
jgi:hypothetical protein